MDDGDFISIGNYAMGDWSPKQFVIDAIMNSTMKKLFIADLEKNITQGYTVDEIMEKMEQFLEDCMSGTYSEDEIKQKMSDVKDLLIAATSAAVYKDVLMPYLMGINLIDGDTKGGVFVNRELYRQKQFQDQAPNMTYTVSITKAQLNKLLNFINDGSNHYSVSAHNCSTFANEAWNAAVGYADDDESEHSDYYINGADTTYELLNGLLVTPKGIYDAIKARGNSVKGGTAESWEIVPGNLKSRKKKTDPTPSEEESTSTDSGAVYIPVVDRYAVVNTGVTGK